ncbi:MAG: TetR/AcrR family transcriptional regulator [Bacteroidetes bacterium]|nr:TetR/AcrR family transcriptional regulator [Bacteroidota bacterium]MCB0842491.1 TetR/AcrR family transcriptional regulator [Bacteroidota bacterium]MCB0853000.1 TetR/AcrR family transcriptional regulator [Bacteroidota bacterium]
MTDKKVKILETALELFATQGYNAVATNKLAKQAGVSEGLIFKHFTNKKGLLDALLNDAERRMGQLFGPVLMETDPAKVIKMTIELPFSIPQSEYNFWRLQFKLKWQGEYYKPDKMKPVLEKLTAAFQALEYDFPQYEAEVLNYIIDSVSVGILRDGLEKHFHQKDFLIKKYKL